jgi:glycosyltransferase involved in cell wall biosynthesis
MKKINLGVLVSTLTVGGAEQVLLELLRNIDRNRFDIQVFFLQDPGIIGKELEKLDIQLTTNIRKNRLDVFTIFRLRKLFVLKKIESLLLLDHRDTLFYGVPAARLAGVCPVINWEHVTFMRYSWHRLTMFARRVVVHLGVDNVVAVARGHKDYIAREEKIPARKITAIYNGVDPEKFRSDLTREQARNNLGLTSAVKVVSIIAVLRPDKAHEVFLKAARKVLEQNPGTHFLVIGDGPLKARLEAQAKLAGIDEHVHFLGFRRDLHNILPAIDVNVLSSKPLQETLSVAALEAMSAGIPMVCTRVGFMDEIVIDGETGYLVDVDDPVGLARKILEILDDEDLRLKMGQNARKMVDETFNIRLMTRSFENLFSGES